MDKIQQLREHCTKTYGAFLKAREVMPEWKAYEEAGRVFNDVSESSKQWKTYEKARGALDKEQARLKGLADSTTVASGFKEDPHAHT